MVRCFQGLPSKCPALRIRDGLKQVHIVYLIFAWLHSKGQKNTPKGEDYKTQNHGLIVGHFRLTPLVDDYDVTVRASKAPTIGVYPIVSRETQSNL